MPKKVVKEQEPVHQTTKILHKNPVKSEPHHIQAKPAHNNKHHYDNVKVVHKESKKNLQAKKKTINAHDQKLMNAHNKYNRQLQRFF